MIRHGESEWNKLNKFCGWFDSDLSEKGNILIFFYELTMEIKILIWKTIIFFKKGIEEAKAGGKALKDGAYVFDVAHTSVLKRAQITLGICLKNIGLVHC